MINKKIMLALIAFGLVLLIGCQSNKISNKQFTASEVLQKAQQAMNPNGEYIKPNGEFIKPKSFKVSLTWLQFMPQTRFEKKYQLSCILPDKYLLKSNILTNTVDNDTRETSTVCLSGDNIVWEKKNGKIVKPDLNNHDRITRIQERISEFMHLVSFSVLINSYDLKLSRKTHYIDGFECYKLKSKLGDRTSGGSNTYTYYIDIKNHLIRQIESDIGLIKKIRHKNFGMFILPYKYELHGFEPYENISYVNVDQIELNPNIDSSLFKSKEIVGHEI